MLRPTTFVFVSSDMPFLLRYIAPPDTSDWRCLFARWLRYQALCMLEQRRDRQILIDLRPVQAIA